MLLFLLFLLVIFKAIQLNKRNQNCESGSKTNFFLDMLQSFTFDPYILRLDAQPLVCTSVQVNSGTVQQCYC